MEIVPYYGILRRVYHLFNFFFRNDHAFEGGQLRICVTVCSAEHDAGSDSSSFGKFHYKTVMICWKKGRLVCFAFLWENWIRSDTAPYTRPSYLLQGNKVLRAARY